MSFSVLVIRTWDREDVRLFKVLNIPWRKEAVSDEILVLEVTQKVTPEGCASRAMAVTVSPPLTWSHT
tara:strand:+ start:1209 stop:1412 length:204 start_codon:yes stop_codon:yes gene_type:complete